MSYQGNKSTKGPQRKTVIKTMTTVLNEAAVAIDDGINNTNPALQTRWRGMNSALYGGFKFDTNVVVAGASGHGKSYLANMLMQDFLNPLININFPKPFKILNFGFEMTAADEMLRRLSAMTSISYQSLVGSMDKVTPQQLLFIKEKMKQIADDPVFFIETPMSRFEIYDIIQRFKVKYPNHEVIVSLDHTLLVHPEPGESEVDALAGLAKLFIEIRKEFKSLNFLLGQLNDKIESEKRLDPNNPSLHYPTKTDIHGSKQLYHAADIVTVIHQPSLLHLEYYGKKAIPTQGLVAFHILKNRRAQQGLTLLKNNLNTGVFDEWDYVPAEAPASGYGLNRT